MIEFRSKSEDRYVVEMSQNTKRNADRSPSGDGLFMIVFALAIFIGTGILATLLNWILK